MDNITEDIRIIPYDITYLTSYNEMMNEISKEGLYLSTSSGFSLESSESFMRDCIKNKYPAYLVLNCENTVVGWCDIVNRPEFSDKHTGSLGVGLRKGYRDAGIGRILISKALEAASLYGFERVILVVRKSNERAIHVYKLLGFSFDADGDSFIRIDDEKIEVTRMTIDIEPSTEFSDDSSNSFGCGTFLGIALAGAAIGLIIALLCIIL